MRQRVASEKMHKVKIQVVMLLDVPMAIHCYVVDLRGPAMVHIIFPLDMDHFVL